ncbi:MAG TPA: hypothetical protein IAB22_05405 [Candidatus Merdivicinus intestinavium]|nr:hypothetical protein [Candidatus Merdivicinus intestinavium]
MNLIPCGKNCRFQQDGYCVRTGMSVAAEKVDGCCYFEAKEKDAGGVL